MPTHIHPFLQFTVIIGYLNVGLLVGSLCSGLFVDCSILLQFYCNSPARLWVLALILSQLVFQSCQAHFQTLVLKFSDVGIFCFWTITRICFFAMFCLRWFLSSSFNLDLERIIWLGIYPSSERLKTPVGLVVLFASSVHLRDDYYHFICNPLFTIICSSIHYVLYIHLFIDKMIVITLATLFTIFRSSLLWDH